MMSSEYDEQEVSEELPNDLTGAQRKTLEQICEEELCASSVAERADISDQTAYKYLRLFETQGIVRSNKNPDANPVKSYGKSLDGKIYCLKSRFQSK